MLNPRTNQYIYEKMKQNQKQKKFNDFKKHAQKFLLIHFFFLPIYPTESIESMMLKYLSHMSKN